MTTSKEPLFDLSAHYDEMLHRGLKLSGETKEYFIRMRMKELARLCPVNFKPEKILDFGCGVGDASYYLAKTFPESKVIGTDTSEEALKYAAVKYRSNQLEFLVFDNFIQTESLADLCYCSGVFHHIAEKDREDSLKLIFKKLNPGGFFALFENNPLNVGTHIVMSRIPFDREAKLISPFAMEERMRKAGFSIRVKESLFYFPKWLSALRVFEPSLARLPFGAQYFILGEKPRE